MDPSLFAQFGLPGLVIAGLICVIKDQSDKKEAAAKREIENNQANIRQMYEAIRSVDRLTDAVTSLLNGRGGQK